MGLSASTSTRLGDWLNRNTAPQPADPASYFDDNPDSTSTPKPSQSNTSAFTPASTSSGLLSSNDGNPSSSDDNSAITVRPPPILLTPGASPPDGTAPSTTTSTTPAGPATPASPPGTTTNAQGVTTLNVNDLTARVVDPATETVEGRMKGLLSDNEYVDAFRKRADRDSNARGLLNSTMATSAGEEAAVNAAMPIASADASTFGRAADYNTALSNQGTMYNAEAYNKMSADQLAAAVQREVTKMQTDASMHNADTSAAATAAAAGSAAGASMYGADVASRTAAANREFTGGQNDADRLARQRQQDSVNHQSLINGIINNNDIPPERRAAMLEALGEHALAQGIYVIDSTSGDLGGGGPPGGGGPDNGAGG